MDYSKLIDTASKISLAVVLMIILVGGVQGYWVAGTTYRDMIAERNSWKELALKGTKVAEQATQRVTTGPPGRRIPLPYNPTPADVDAKLDALTRKTAYVTEPTDKPLP